MTVTALQVDAHGRYVYIAFDEDTDTEPAIKAAMEAFEKTSEYERMRTESMTPDNYFPPDWNPQENNK